MGNSASSSSKAPHDDSVDFGFLGPQGVYSGPRDWNESIVARLIIDRKLAPFYRPLEDYDDSWDDEKVLAARKDPPPSPTTEGDAQHPIRSDQASINSRHSHHHKRSATAKEPAVNPEAAIYRNAVECPICFLYYPPNINRSRCCDQAICTECFVQIKRSEPTVTHLVSDPACCPYCVQEHFGVVYTPPNWRAGLGSEGSSLPPWPDALQRTQSLPTSLGKQKRRKSFGHEDPDVVTIDHIRPDWEAKLQAVRAQAARRANRRIIMRQVGDRLIPVGITSGRVHALPAELGAAAADVQDGSNGTGSRRSRRRQQNEIANLIGGMAGPDLEELMVMEAMRLSLLEHEEQQRREREAQARAQNGGEGASQAHAEGEDPTPPPVSSSELLNAPTVAPADQALATAPTHSRSSSTSTSTAAPASSSPTSSGSAAGTPAPTHGDATPVQTAFTPAEVPSHTLSHASSTPEPTSSSLAHTNTDEQRLPTTDLAATPTAARPHLPAALVQATRDPISRSDTLASIQTEASADSRVEERGYGPLMSDSEESIVAREPLLQIGDDA